LRALLDYAWPGNIRELRNVVEYAFAVGRGPELTVDELPPEFREARVEPVRAHGHEERRILDALSRSHGDVAAAAASCGMSRTTFWRRRRALGV
jgi:two-component system response regulator AtoC